MKVSGCTCSTQENDVQLYVISGFCCDVGENCAVLDYYGSSGNFLLTVQNNLLVPSSRVKKTRSKGSRIQRERDTSLILGP